eukprot:1837908-Prymnesium_polylepis.3
MWGPCELKRSGAAQVGRLAPHGRASARRWQRRASGPWASSSGRWPIGARCCLGARCSRRRRPPPRDSLRPPRCSRCDAAPEWL